ncbi:lamin tail domain-containing protein [Chloroflexota bacterium]
MRRGFATFILIISLVLSVSSCIIPTSQPTITTPNEQEPTEPIQTPSSTQPTPTTTEEPDTTSDSTSSSATTPSPTTPTPQYLNVYYLDVGQGDSIFIDYGQTEVLIDGGDRSPGVVGYISPYVDGALEVLVATHPHADHIGGLITVLQQFDIKEVWHNGDSSTSNTYTEFMFAVQTEGAEVNIGKRGDNIVVADLSFNVLNPASLSGTTNNNSLVLALSFGGIDFLFTGDAEQEAESSMLISSVVPVPDVNILKVGHHGSNTASSQDFIKATNPEVAIYMAGSGNSYGHPHQETLIALDNTGAMIYGTDVHGTIIVTTNGQTYDIHLENQASPITPNVVTPPSTPPLIPTPTPSTATSVQITKIFYDGLVSRIESDEYVEITNLGSESVDLKNWVIKDISEGYPSLTFSSYVLQPGKSVRVYTNEIHPEYGGFSFGSGKAVWNNTSSDTAALFNTQGQEVSRKSY